MPLRDAIRRARVLVVGDVMLDRYWFGDVSRISPEAPVPVVFLSAKGQESEIQTGLEAGAEEYLLKPFSPDELTSRVKTILSKFGK